MKDLKIKIGLEMKAPTPIRMSAECEFEYDHTGYYLKHTTDAIKRGETSTGDIVAFLDTTLDNAQKFYHTVKLTVILEENDLMTAYVANSAEDLVLIIEQLKGKIPLNAQPKMIVENSFGSAAFSQFKKNENSLLLLAIATGTITAGCIAYMALRPKT